MLYLALVFRILGSWFTVEIGKKTQPSDLEEPDPIQLYSLLPSRSPYMSVSLSLSPTVVEKKDQRGRERERGREDGCQEKIGNGERTNKFLGGRGGGRAAPAPA